VYQCFAKSTYLQAEVESAASNIRGVVKRSLMHFANKGMPTVMSCIPLMLTACNWRDSVSNSEACNHHQFATSWEFRGCFTL
jgi:hypothetical protein